MKSNRSKGNAPGYSDNSLDFTYNSQKQTYIRKKKNKQAKHASGGKSGMES